MKLFSVFVLFVALFAVTLAAESRGLFTDPAHPGKCVYQGLVLSPGEEGKVKGKCQRLLCHEADGFGVLQGCGTQAIMPPCKLGDYVNVDAPYGECCKRHVICP